MRLIQSKSPRKAIRDVKKKFLEIEEEKKLAIWSKKLTDIKAEEAAGFSTSENPRMEAASETVIQKILQESKLALPFVEVYSWETNSHYQSYIYSCEHVFDTRPTTILIGCRSCIIQCWSFERHTLHYLVPVCGGTWEIVNFMEKIQEVSVG